MLQNVKIVLVVNASRNYDRVSEIVVYDLIMYSTQCLMWTCTQFAILIECGNFTKSDQICIK